MKTLLDVYIENGGDVGRLDSESLESAAHMIMEYDTIETLQSISTESIMFFFWASGGAMVAPNEIRIILRENAKGDSLWLTKQKLLCSFNMHWKNWSLPYIS